MCNFFSKIKNHITGNEFANTFYKYWSSCLLYFVFFFILGKKVGAFIALMTK